MPLYNGHAFKVCFSYHYKSKVYPVVNDENIKYNDCISIDLGMKNLLTIHDPTDRQLIISGKPIIGINHYYNDYIDWLKSETKKLHNKDTSKRIRDLWIKRENVIENYFNRLVRLMVEKYKHKKRIIVGYNTNWKSNCNLRGETKRDFQNIPYRKLLDKLRFQFKQIGIELIEINEAYTSKCDSLALENIGCNNEYLGKRIHRGLFSSSKGYLLNADINGAINIMRKYFDKIGRPITEVKGVRICNPIKMKKIQEMVKLSHKIGGD